MNVEEKIGIRRPKRDMDGINWRWDKRVRCEIIVILEGIRRGCPTPNNWKKGGEDTLRYTTTLN